MFMQWLFWSCVGLVGYTYVVYPLILLIVSRLHRAEAKQPSLPENEAEWPRVTMVIAAYNEAKVIEEKIANSLAQEYPADRLRIVVASDGSDDGTNALVAACRDPRVQLIACPERRGKIATINATIPQLSDEILVMSDADAMYAPDAVKNLVKQFADERVGVVSGELEFIAPSGGGSGEGLYWKYETWVKKMEGRFGFLLGASGAIFAIRRSLFRQLPPNTINEDFVVPMKVLEDGYRVCFAPDAHATHPAAATMADEMRRKVRIGAGGFQGIRLTTAMLNPLRGLPALGYWSHKVIRWCVPFLMLGAFLTNIPLAFQPFYAYLLAVQCAAYAIGIQGLLPQPLPKALDNKLFKPIRYFFLMNLGLFLGFFRYLFGTQKVTWERAAR
jgi:cellulose synthase/poly-beta-1,6-N-acetylglucosamine synthase-like glycosyltransferase